jgi:hypothetical protein
VSGGVFFFLSPGARWGGPRRGRFTWAQTWARAPPPPRGGPPGPDWASFKAVPYEPPPKAAPEFSLPDLDGRPVALADFRGKVTLVFFWATW